MKKRLQIIASFFFSTLLLASCWGGEKNTQSIPQLVNVSVGRLDSVAEFHDLLQETPSQVAVALFNSITDGDVKTVMNNIHFSKVPEREAFEGYLEMAVSSEDFAERTKGYVADYRSVFEEINGDTAFVELVGTTVLGEMTRFKVMLVMVDGWWKVDGPYSVLHRQIVDAE